MTAVCAIDPGSEHSGYVILDAGDERVAETGNLANGELLEWIGRLAPDELDAIVLEWTAPRGMLGSAQLFETLYWTGRFYQAAVAAGVPVHRLERVQAKMYLVGQRNAKDPQIRAALIDRFGGVGGKAAAVGTKRDPGPLYGVATHAWAALAIAVTFADEPQREFGL